MRTFEIENEILKASVRAYGAELCSLVKKETGEQYLWSGDAKYWTGISPLLFPVVGNFRDKQYRYQGKTYTMKQHGFAREKEFSLVSRTENELWLAIEDDPETYSQYPFRFRLPSGREYPAGDVESEKPGGPGDVFFHRRPSGASLSAVGGAG